LFATGVDERGEKRVRGLDATLIFRMVLHPDEERMIGQLDRFHQLTARR
jgi:hypothetical protein